MHSESMRTTIYVALLQAAVLCCPAFAQPRTVLDISGGGTKSTQTFTVEKSWLLQWSYDCSNFGDSGSFMVAIKNSDGSPSDNEDVSQSGTSGADIEYYHTGGSYYLEVDSECKWHIAVQDSGASSAENPQSSSSGAGSPVKRTDTKSQNTPAQSISEVRKIYVMYPTGIKIKLTSPPYERALVLEGKTLVKSLGKSKCLQIAADPSKADAILVPMPHRNIGWVGAINRAYDATQSVMQYTSVCSMSNSRMICGNGDGSFDITNFGAGGWTDTEVPNVNTGDDQVGPAWYFVDPKSGKLISDWFVMGNGFHWNPRKEIEAAVGCPQ